MGTVCIAYSHGTAHAEARDSAAAAARSLRTAATVALAVPRAPLLGRGWPAGLPPPSSCEGLLDCEGLPPRPALCAEWAAPAPVDAEAADAEQLRSAGLPTRPTGIKAPPAGGCAVALGRQAEA